MALRTTVPVGRVVTFTKTVSESDIYLFAGITGDFDRNHTNEEFCRAAGLGGRIAHGALLVGFMSTVSSLAFADFEPPIVSLGYDHVRFTKPVHPGDTVTAEYTITSSDNETNRVMAEVIVRNQHQETVAVATHIHKLLSQ